MMERMELERVAQQYRADGYEVIVSPRSADLPEFLRKHPLDLLARRGTENVVVEVKRRKDLQNEHQLAYLAAEVNAVPGWRFDLYVTNGDPWPDAMPEDATEPGTDRIREFIQSTQELLSQGQLAAACLIGWSAVEAALRSAAEKSSISLEHKEPQYVLEAMASEGVLSQEEYRALQAALRTRNAVAHGLYDPGLTERTPQLLVDAALRILELELAPSGT